MSHERGYAVADSATNGEVVLGELVDTSAPNTPGWWLRELATRLHDRRNGRHGNKKYRRDSIGAAEVRPGLCLLRDYLAGDPPLRSDIHSGWAAPFRQFVKMGRLNMAPILVSSRSNRMGIVDFRTAAADDELGDAEARKLMRRNKLKVKARTAHDDLLGYGDVYGLVTPPDANRDWSLITIESPLETIAHADPATGETLVGLKMFHSPVDGADFAYLYMPGKVYRARLDTSKSTLWAARRFTLADGWVWDKDIPVPGGRMALVHVENKDGKSEIEGHLDPIDRINDEIFNAWWLAKIQAFRQRALEMAGDDDEYEDDEEEVDEDGRPINPAKWSDDDWANMFTSAPDSLWRLPAGAKIWESTPVDVTGLVNHIKAELQWFAFTTSTPLYLITPDAANGSAEGATTQKEEHVFEILDRRDRVEEFWAELISLAFEFQDMADRADVSQIDAVWGPLELISWQEKSTAAAALKDILPQEAIWSDVLGFSTTEIVERLRPLRNKDLLYAPPGAPTGSFPGTPVPVPGETAGTGSAPNPALGGP